MNLKTAAFLKVHSISMGWCCSRRFRINALEMLQATYKIVDDRQREINPDPNYWSRNVINYIKER